MPPQKTAAAIANELAKNAAKFASSNPYATAAIGTGTLIVLAPGIASATGLSFLGLTSNGVVGGSIASAVQSNIGSVVAPSIFSTLQSAAAGGYGVAVTNGVVQGVGGVISVGGLAAIYRKASGQVKSKL